MPAWNLLRLNQWVSQSSLQGLEDAYQAAQTLKSIEEKHFQDEPIAFLPHQGKTVSDYFGSQRDQQLLRVRLGLARFRVIGFWLNRTTAETDQVDQTTEIQPESPEAIILSKLAFIESVVCRYREDELDLINRELSTAPPTGSALTDLNQGSGAIAPPSVTANPTQATRSPNKKQPSFLDGLGQFSKELKPEYEQEVVQELRQRRKQNKIAVRWLIILLLVPVLVQVATRNLVFEPILNAYGESHYREIKITDEVAEGYIANFSRLKETLEIKELLGLIPEMTTAKKKAKIKESATALAREAVFETLNGVKNMLADGVSLVVFAVLVFVGRDKLSALRNFSNRAFLSLSDPLKVFLFILVTDMFVGFHSPEGWEVILEGVSEHFGFPPSKVFVNLFIATVPVIMDTFIKFWIFNYLTRYSPSTSAIYERMNN
jgi:CemA family